MPDGSIKHYEKEVKWFDGTEGMQDVADAFIDVILKEYNDLKPLLYRNVPMRSLTKEEKRNFYTIQNCSICGEVFKIGDIRVKDHDHMTGEYLGPAHQWCNINRKISTHLPIVIHNFKSYDCHLFIEALCVRLSSNKVSVIGKTMDQYTSVWTKQFRFIDSCQQ